MEKSKKLVYLKLWISRSLSGLYQKHKLRGLSLDMSSVSTHKKVMSKKQQKIDI